MDDATQEIDSQPTNGRKADQDSIAEILYGRPVLPIDAFAFGRRIGRRMERLFPDKVVHVLEGIRSGIEQVRERKGAHESAGGQTS